VGWVISAMLTVRGNIRWEGVVVLAENS